MFWGFEAKTRKAGAMYTSVSGPRVSGPLTFVVGDDAVLGRSAWTQRPIKHTCPSSCPNRGGGCYILAASPQRARGVNDALEKWCDTVAHFRIGDPRFAIIEASKIAKAARHADRHLPLRLHKGGEFIDEADVRTVAQACKLWPGPVYTYTHRSRQIPRDAFGVIKVRASVHSIAEVKLVKDRGYAVAWQMHEFKSLSPWQEQGLRIRPCPIEVGEIKSKLRGVKYEDQPNRTTCAECRLCWSSPNEVIAFADHGQRKNTLLPATSLVLTNRVAASS